jgi:glycosyltransferase involved in cell wall biosynthesis
VGRFRIPKGLAQAIGDADVLLLHSAWVLHNVVAARAASRAGVPYVLTPHGGYDPNVLRRRRIAKTAWSLLLERDLLVNAAAIHVFFEGEQESIRALGYRGPFITVPNGIEVPAAPTWDGGSGGYLLWLGRYDVEHKGLDVLLEALRHIPAAERPVLRMHGPDHKGGRAVVQRLVGALGLNASVVVSGPVYGREKEQMLSRARAFIYPSRWDSHSVAVTEALARGIPCIITRSMQLARLLECTGAAFVADLDPSDLGTKMGRAMSHEGQVVGAEGRRLVVKHFRWEVCGAELVSQLKSVLGLRATG